MTSGNFRDCRARGQNHLRGPCLKIFANQDYSSSSFSLKLLCLKGVFKYFPVISFQFFLRCRALSELPKVRGLGPWPPWLPLKTATAHDHIVLLLKNMFREGIPSAVAGFQGALHLHTKIPLKSKN